MPGLFEVDFDTTEMTKVFARMDRRSRVAQPGIMKVVAEMLVTEVSDRYDDEGGGEWEELTLETIRRKGSSQIMFDKGVLSGSTKARSGSDFAEAGTSVAYVVFHLDGGPIMPRRNPFELGDDAFQRIEDFIVGELAKAMTG